MGDTIKSVWGKLTEKWWFFPLIMFVVMALAYALNLSQMGYYWDDWEALYFAKQSDVTQIWNYYKFDRPFSGFYYWVMFQIVGVGPVRWQILNLVFRYVGFLGFYFVISLMWKNAKTWLKYAALLLAVFPGFTQGPITLAYFRVHTSFALLMISLLLTILGISAKKHAWAYHLGALFLSLIQCLLVEYFVPLEGIRLLLIFFYLQNEGQSGFWKTFKKTGLLYLPYAVVLFAYLVYRFIFFEQLFGVENNNDAIYVGLILQGDFGALIDLIQIIAQDILSILFHSYAAILDPEVIQAKGYIILSFILGTLVTVCIYLISLSKEKISTRIVRQLFMVGFACLVLGGLPIWLMGRQTFVGLWSDRFLLAPMVGIVLLMACFFHWIGQSSKQSALVFCFLIGLSVAFQIRNTYLYKQEWDQQRAFYWQLHWRVPGIEEDTLIVSPTLPLSHVSSYAIGIAINHLYEVKPFTVTPNYWYINSSHYFGVSDAENLVNDYPVNTGVRSVSYEGDLARTVGIAHNPKAGRCLRILDEPYNLFAEFSSFSGVEQRLYQVGQPDNWILPESKFDPPVDFFGKEPAHDWCYYFQKADLARQQEDWAAVIEITEQAEQAGYASKFVWEYVPELMAYAMTEDWNSFEALSMQIVGFSEADNFSDFVRYAAEKSPGSAEKEPAIERVLKTYDY